MSACEIEPVTYYDVWCRDCDWGERHSDLDEAAGARDDHACPAPTEKT